MNKFILNIIRLQIYIFTLLFSMLCFGGQTFIVNEDGISLGGGGRTNKCNFIEDNEGNVGNWKERSFPVPIAISKDLSSRRKEIILQAIKIWNDHYLQYLKTYVHDYESKKYPRSLFKYDSTDPDDLYIDAFWYIFPLTAPLVILDRMIRFPGGGRGVIEQMDGHFDDNRRGVGETFLQYVDNYIRAGKITMLYKPVFYTWHDSLSSSVVGVDYLTIVLHELGHLIGLAHDEKERTLMHKNTHAGKRYLPGKRDMDRIFCQYKKYWDQVDFPRRGTIIP